MSTRNKTQMRRRQRKRARERKKFADAPPGTFLEMAEALRSGLAEGMQRAYNRLPKIKR